MIGGIHMKMTDKVKTLQVSENVHILVVEKQLNLRKKGVHRTFIEIADEAIAAGIDIIE
jgi:hypothetical protein